MARVISTGYSSISSKSYRNLFLFDRVALDNISKGKHLVLLEDLISVLDMDGEKNLFHSGISSVDAYQINNDGLRAEYFCDSLGHGIIVLGIQAVSGKKGYADVLSFEFNLKDYESQIWSLGYIDNVKNQFMIKIYIPSDSKEMINVASRVEGFQGNWEQRLSKRVNR